MRGKSLWQFGATGRMLWLAACVIVSVVPSSAPAAARKNKPKPFVDPATGMAESQLLGEGSIPHLAGRTKAGDPLPGLTKPQLQRFVAGLEVFDDEETIEDGVGPVMNDISCVACHEKLGGSDRISNIIGDKYGGKCEEIGGGVIQLQAIGIVEDGFEFVPEIVPDDPEVIVGRRRAMTTRGLGLVGAVPDSTLLNIQKLQQERHPSTAGKASIVIDAITGQTRVGRVGQKCQHASATTFFADAYLNEMGITTPFFPDENPPQGDASALIHNPVPEINDDGADVFIGGDAMEFSAPSPRVIPVSRTGRLRLHTGEVIFHTIGCADCHTPALKTGAHAVAALSRKSFYPHSDFLLHDMGENGDGILQATDTGGQLIPGSWMRTTPLWGVSLNPVLWHDGRVAARDYDAAIGLHSGQGAQARSRWNSLPDFVQDAVVAYLDSL